jgi:hypothetical protein
VILNAISNAEPHDLCEDARNRLSLAVRAASTIQQTIIPTFHRSMYGLCFKDKVVEMLAFLPFPSVFRLLDTRSTICFDLDSRALVDPQPPSVAQRKLLGA